MGAEEDFARFSEIAEELGLEEKEFDSFVSSSMKRKGYKPVLSWADPDPENGGQGGGDFFSQRREGQQRREVRRGNGTEGRSRGGSGYYDN